MRTLALEFCITVALAFCAGPAFAVTEVFFSGLDGMQENPDVPTTATGFGTATYDSDLNTLAVDLQFSGLTSNTSNAHIHCCATSEDLNSGIAIHFVPFGFPLDVLSGSFSHTYDLGDTASFDGGFLTASGGTADAARDRLLGSMRRSIDDSIAYFNIHTDNHGGGEIRGNIMPIPEPTAIVSALAACLGLVAMRRR